MRGSGALVFHNGLLGERIIMNLYENLCRYGASDIYPMHMPGHKRNPSLEMVNPYGIDVTEVRGMDNLHHPNGMIRELMDRMKRVYRTRESYLLVNGSTCGILTAISACVRRGDTVVIGRNCHRSVYHAAYLWDLKLVYLYPDTDGRTGIALEIRADQVGEALRENPEASCVVITSPTYEGVVSDIRDIAGVVHRRDIPLVVDEAHGAHLPWGHPVWGEVPEPATSQGADLVVESLHKTLPALTQTGVLHLCTDRVPPEKVERYLDIYESSSPSYVLMASAAQCLDWMEHCGRRAFAEYAERLGMFYRQAGRWRHIALWEHPQKEPSKLVILVDAAKMSGPRLAELLRERYRVEVEMEAANYVLAMTSICDTEEGLQRLSAALAEIDAKINAEINVEVNVGMEAVDGAGTVAKFGLACGRIALPESPAGRIPGGVSGRARMGIYEAMNAPYRECPLADCEGEVSAEYALVYPPGIPFLVPGEEIGWDVLERIQTAGEMGMPLMGLSDGTGSHIRVCAPE